MDCPDDNIFNTGTTIPVSKGRTCGRIANARSRRYLLASKVSPLPVAPFKRSGRIRLYTPGSIRPIPFDLFPSGPTQAGALSGTSVGGSSPSDEPAVGLEESPTMQATVRRSLRPAGVWPAAGMWEHEATRTASGECANSPLFSWSLY